LSGLADAALAAKAAANDERGYLVSGDPKFKAEAVQRRDAERTGLAQARAVAMSADQVRAVDEIRTGLDAFNQALDREFAIYATDRAAAMTLAFGKNRDLRKAYETKFATATQAAKSAAAKTASVADGLATGLQSRLVLLLGLVIAIGAAAAWLLSRMVNRPLAESIAVLEAAATGDLRRRAPVRGAPEFRRMAEATNEMLDATGHAVTAISDNARSLDGTAVDLEGISAATADAIADATGQAESVSAAAGQVAGSVAAL